jgi:hypothetical protein
MMKRSVAGLAMLLVLGSAAFADTPPQPTDAAPQTTAPPLVITPPTAAPSAKDFPASQIQAAIGLLDVTMSDGVMVSADDMVLATFSAMGKNTMPVTDAVRADIREEIVRQMPAYRAALAPYYAKHFSEAELRDLTAYLQTPVYAQYSAQLPQMMSEAAPQILNLIVPAFAARKDATAMPQFPKMALPDPVDPHLAAALAVTGTMTSVVPTGMMPIGPGGAGTGAAPNAQPPEYAAMAKTMMDDFKLIVARIYVEHFSQDELVALKAFLETPQYRDYQARQLAITRESAPVLLPQMLGITVGAITHALDRQKQQESGH